MLCLHLPSPPPRFLSLSSLRHEWRRRYTSLARDAAAKGLHREVVGRFEAAAGDDAYFVTDLGDVGSETDVWNNCERVLVLLFMHFIDLDSRLGGICTRHT